MNEQENKLKSLLIKQQFGEKDGLQLFLETAQKHAYSYAQATNGIAVLSDLQDDVCYIYSGSFGKIFGLSEYFKDTSSAFERSIFNNIIDNELVQRHILELRFFHFIKSIPIAEKTNYHAACVVHFQTPDQSKVTVLHTTRYIECYPNGSVWLGLCTYIPLPIKDIMEGCIINTITGQPISPEQYIKYDKTLLSKRQIEILSLLSKGIGSKQIADKLNISLHTVNRHRQDILSRLKVTNSAAAVEIGLRMGLI